MDSAHPALQPRPVLSPLRRPLVAVLPFTAVGGDGRLRMVGAEIADRLRERLARDPAVQALLIRSDFLAEAPPHALELVCRELRVGHLISGKCHPTGERPSVYIELADTREWHIRWAEFYAGGARDLLDPDGRALDAAARELSRELLLRTRR